MLIGLKCSNDICGYAYDIAEGEFLENPKAHTNCLVCGSQLKVTNLDEIIKTDIYKKAENNIDKWVKEIGWDNTLDMIQRNKNQACYRIYCEILSKIGFKIV